MFKETFSWSAHVTIYLQVVFWIPNNKLERKFLQLITQMYALNDNENDTTMKTCGG